MFRISVISTLAASAVYANEVDAEGRRRGGYGHGPGYGYGRPGIAPQRGPMSHNISNLSESIHPPQTIGFQQRSMISNKKALYHIIIRTASISWTILQI